MKITTQKLALPALIAALTLALALMVTVSMARDAHGKALHDEAKVIFSFDNQNPGVLPATKVRALSIALQFHDDRGAARLIAELSSRN